MNALLTAALNVIAFAALALGALGLLLVGASADPGRDGGRALMSMMLCVPLVVGLLLSYGLGVARGQFAWLAPDTLGLQWLLTLAGALAAGAVLAGSAALRLESVGQVPWALWPLRSWAFAVWAPLLVAGAALTLWPSWRAHWPDWTWQIPLVALGMVSLLAGAGLLVQAVQAAAERNVAQIQQQQADEAERDQWITAKVVNADVEHDLVSLMSQTSRYESAPIRALALEKVRSHPDLNRALADMLAGDRRDQALIFLESNDAPDNRALLLPVQAALFGMADELRDAMRRTHTLQADAFDPKVQRLLAVADKFDALGGHNLAAVRAVRAALDEPRPSYSPAVTLNARATLDRWIKQHAS